MLMQWLRRKRPPRERRAPPQAEWLEPRLLYSADAAGLIGLSPTDAPVAEARSLDAGFNYVMAAEVSAGSVNTEPVAADVAAAGAEDATSIAITLEATDADGVVAGFQLLGLPADGVLYTDAALTTPADTATIYAGASRTLYFAPAPDFNGTTSFLYTAVDDLGAGDADGATATLTVSAVNDAPVLTAGTVGNVAVFEGSAGTPLGLAGLSYAAGGGADEAGQALAFAVTAVPPASVGQVVLADGTTAVAPGTYTLAQLRGMQFRAAPGVVSASGTFAFTVRDDGGTAGGGSDTLTQSITVAVVNQAPVLAGANAMNPVYEDFPATGPTPTNPPPHTNPAQRAGTLVSDLVAGQVSDPGGVFGIAITGVDATNGRWEYSVDGATTWNSLDAVTPGAALLLAPDGQTRVRFLPNANFAGTAGLTFRAWDRTAGTVGGTADTTLNGGSTAFSADARTTSVTVSAVNDAPERTSGALATVTVPEGAPPVSLGLSGLAYGPGGGADEAAQVLTYTVTGVPPNAFGHVLLANGTVVAAGSSYTLADFQGMQFRPAAGAGPGSATLSFTVKDDAGKANGGDDSTNQSLTITIGNLAPVLLGANAMTGIQEDATANAGTLVSDLVAGQITDAGGRFGIAVTSAASAGGTWEFSTNGGTSWTGLATSSASSARLLAADAQTRVRFVPAADWAGTASFSFRGWDRSSGTAGGTADTTVNGGASAFSLASHGSSITVSPVNDAPVRTAGVVSNITVAEDSGETPLGLSGVGYGPGGGADEAGQVLTYTVTVVPPASLGRIVLADGTTVTTGPYSLDDLRGMRFVTAPDAFGTGTFAYTVADDGGGSTNALGQTLQVTVTSVDDASVLAADAVAVNEDSAASGNVLANDTDADDALQVTAFDIAGTSYAAGSTALIAGVGSFSLAADGAFTFTPVANWSGLLPQVAYTTNTGASSTLQVTVNAVDDASVLVPDSATVNEDAAAGGNVLSNDSDVDTALQVATFAVGGTGYAAGATATLTGVGSFTLAADGTFTFTPLANWNGAVPQVSYTTNSGASSTLQITVAPVDDASVLVADAVAVNEDSAATGNVLANDSDVDDALQVAAFEIGGTTYAAGSTALIAGAGSFSLAADGSFTFTPLPDWNGSVPLVTYTTGTGSRSTLSVAVGAVNDAPVAADATASGPEDSAVIAITLGGSDVDGNVAGVTLQALPANGLLYTDAALTTLAEAGTLYAGSSRSLYFVPAANFHGTVAFRYTVTDDLGASDATPATATITVTPLNDAPVARPDAHTVAEGGSVTGNVLPNDTDADLPLDTLVATLVTGPAHGSLTLNADGSFSYVHDGSENFTDTFTYQVADANGATSQAIVTITVGALDDATVAADDAVTVREDAVAAGNVLANDSDPDSALLVSSFRVAGDPATYLAGETAAIAGVGTFTLAAGGSFTFTPLADWNGTVPQVRYATADGAAATLTMTVAPVNDAPVLSGANDLPAQREDDGGGAGMTVANLVAGRWDDVDGNTRPGIAVTGASAAGGTWQFSLDGGTRWSDFGAVSEGGARLLDGSARVRFVPAADWNGTAGGLAFRSWDQSTGVAGAVTDAGSNGGETAFSSATAAVRVEVAAVNDAPLDVGVAPAPASIGSAGAAVPLGLAGASYAPGGGLDEAAQGLAVTITTLPDAALGTVLLGDGVTPVEAGRTYSVAELREMRFLAADGVRGTSSLGWSVRDDGGTANGGTDERSAALQISVATAPAPAVLPPSVLPDPEPPLLTAPLPPASAPAPAADAAPVDPSPAVTPAPVAAAAPQDQRARATSTEDALLGSPGSASPVQAVLLEMGVHLQRHVFLQDPARLLGSSLLERGGIGLVGFMPADADFRVTGFAALDRMGSRLAVDEVSQALRSGVFLDQLDRLREELRQEFDLDRTVSISVAGLSLGMSVAYVLWLVRGGVLLGSYLSALPAWRLLDPLPVLSRVGDDEDEDEEEDEEALEDRALAGPDPLRGFS